MMLSDLLAASVAWQPAADDTILIAATEADLAIVETIVATLPGKVRGRILIEVETADRVRELAAPSRLCVTWLVRERGQDLRTAADAWLAEMLPVDADREHRVYAWLSGEVAAHPITSA
jgi:NADPH-dependent ferric siderophore reductase